MIKKNVAFAKMQGFGNDFVLLDFMSEAGTPLKRAKIRQIGDRKTGVGFDQLLVLRHHPKAHARLEIFNTDGSRAEMCGNGLRAAALYLWNQKKFQGKKELHVLTDAGLLRARLIEWMGSRKGKRARIECEMGRYRIEKTPSSLKKGVRVGSATLVPVLVNVGNPHAVFILPSKVKLTPALVKSVGPRVETHSAFPRRTNVEFVQKRSKNSLNVMVWERGVGWTEACGSGAVASAVATQGARQMKIRFPGGTALVTIDVKKQRVLLTGEATWVFSGQLLI